jgi:hypothetical protein
VWEVLCTFVVEDFAGVGGCAGRKFPGISDARRNIRQTERMTGAGM